MAKYDLVIKNGLVVDGLGGEAIKADVAIEKDRIIEVGKISGSGREEVDARDLLITPGFVDIHTHLDGHVTWAEHLDPTALHGVTTAVFGNCGVGFAPCRPEDRQRLIRLMEGVEDIPESILSHGLPWNWTSFPDYLRSLEVRHYDIDIAALLPHAPVRVFAMGQRGTDREPAAADDLSKMAALAKEAMLAGAIGFSTSRSLNHRASDGSHTPTLAAAEAELTAIAMALKDVGSGLLQVISDFDDIDREFGILRRVVEKSGRPMFVTIFQMYHAPDRWLDILHRIEQANRDGLPIRGQVCGRPVGSMKGFEVIMCPFSFCPTYQSLEHLPFAEKVAALRQPAVRGRIISEFAVPIEQRKAEIDRAFASRTVDLRNAARRTVALDGLYPLGDPPDYEPTPDRSVKALAARAGVSAAEFVYDLLLQNNGHTLLYSPAANFYHNNLDDVGTMISHENTVLGLSDAGAHNTSICDASFSTYMLTHWARDRKKGMPLAKVIQGLTSKTAQAVGLTDRGIIAPGYRADVNVIDFSRLELRSPKVVYDLPAGGKRLTQEAVGYVMNVVRGVPTYREGKSTGALPGRLVRKNPHH